MECVYELNDQNSYNWFDVDIILTRTMGGGKGKKDVNSKRTTYFLKHVKKRNRPA